MTAPSLVIEKMQETIRTFRSDRQQQARTHGEDDLGVLVACLFMYTGQLPTTADSLPVPDTRQSFVCLLHDLISLLCSAQEHEGGQQLWSLMGVISCLLATIGNSPDVTAAAFLQDPLDPHLLMRMCTLLAMPAPDAPSASRVLALVHDLVHWSGTCTQDLGLMAPLSESGALERAFDLAAQALSSADGGLSALDLAADFIVLAPAFAGLCMFSEAYGRLLLAAVAYTARPSGGTLLLHTADDLFQIVEVWLQKQGERSHSESNAAGEAPDEDDEVVVRGQHMLAVLLTIAKSQSQSLVACGQRIVELMFRLSDADGRRFAFSTLAPAALRRLRDSLMNDGDDSDATVQQHFHHLADVLELDDVLSTIHSRRRARWCMSSGALTTVEALLRHHRPEVGWGRMCDVAASIPFYVVRVLDFERVDRGAVTSAALSSLESIVASLRKAIWVEAKKAQAHATPVTCDSLWDIMDMLLRDEDMAPDTVWRCLMLLTPSAVHQMSVSLRLHAEQPSPTATSLDFEKLTWCCEILYTMLDRGMVPLTAAARAPRLLVDAAKAFAREGDDEATVDAWEALRYGAAYQRTDDTADGSDGATDDDISIEEAETYAGLFRLGQWDALLLSRPGAGPLWCCNRRCTNMDGAREMDMHLRKCGGCKIARYCSEACQRKAWRAGHRTACIAAAAGASDVPCC